MHHLKHLLVLAALLALIGCSSKDDDDDADTPPAPAWGPTAVAGGDNALLMVTDDMLDWTEVTAAESGITAAHDIDRVVRVPVTGRLVAIVNTDLPTDNTNAQIWYNDSGGTGSWTLADLGAGGSHLDAQHREGGTWDDWDLHDMVFVDQHEGYAVGNNYVLLRTYNGGATWYDMNVYEVGGGTVSYQELQLTSAPTGLYQPGEAVTGSGTGTGTVIAYSVYSETLTVNVSAPFADGETVTGGTSGAVGILSSTGGAIDTLWRWYLRESVSIAAHLAADGTHTLFIGQEGFYFQDIENAVPGVWRIVSNATTVGATRTFTAYGPESSDQRGSGEIGEAANDIEGLFVFDAQTAVAATDDGVWHTVNGRNWAPLTGSDGGFFHTLVYSSETTDASGYLYSLDDTGNVPGRVSVTYTAGTPGSWAVDTAGGWTVHGDLTHVMLFNVDGLHTGFLSGTRLFFMDDGTTGGYWGWCDDAAAASLDDSLWQDNDQTNLGGNGANPVNPTYQKYFAPGTVRCLSRR